jgi:hypothetical protein
MRYLFGLLCVCALVGTSPQSATAQDGEEDTSPEPSLQEPAPSSEAAPEEPALQLKLDDAGVEVVPSPPRTADGYTLEEMDVRVRRARIGLGVFAVPFIVGGVLVGVGTLGADCWCLLCAADYVSPKKCDVLPATGAALMGGGVVGMITSGILMRRRKRDRDSLRAAHYGRPHRAQWDLAQSRLVF